MIGCYSEAKQYLNDLIRPTIFARIEADRHLIDPLERMRYLLSLLHNPQQNYPSVQVSGTAGKGSTSYLLSHILKTAGYIVGFTLSPHLERINERIQINNVPIPDEEFVSILNEVIPAIEHMTHEWIGKPSYFEVLLGMALLYFAKKKVAIVVAEVGLEGKYDGTNILHPKVAVLTNISLDHTRILGNTVEKIAEEAASIIKEPKMTVITGVRQESVKKIVKEKAAACQAKIIWCDNRQLTGIRSTLSGSQFSYRATDGSLGRYSLSLPGSYQLLNAVLALEATRALGSSFSVSDKVINQAFATAFFPGRFEVLKDPAVILDGAHNVAKMQAFIHDLSVLVPQKKKVFLLAFKEDKQVSEMLDIIMPQAGWIIATEFGLATDMQHKAAIAAATIEKTVSEKNSEIAIKAIPTAADALEYAQALARQNNAALIVTGSLYLIGELRPVILSAHQTEKRE